MKIVIVGGGSSGWLVAAGLIKTFPNYKITVVESPTIPTIGVGESTTTLVRNFIKHFLQIDESDFLKNVDGIYKMSVKFNNFSDINNSYDYPFSAPFVDKDLGLTSWDIVKTYNKNLSEKDFVKYVYPSYHLFSNNKIDKNLNNEFDSFDYETNLGYHFDANKLGIYLRDKYCIPKKVTHILSNVLDVKFLDGKVESLVLDNNTQVKADLFIDCTGLKSILLGQKMKPKFIDISDKLFNNRAWATPTKYKDVYKQMQPYTTATAIENGWCWYTPIASRIGNGYAYSDKFVEPEKALQEFKTYLYNSSNYDLTKKEINSLPFFEIKMKTGFYEESMIKNVAAIGMASGFLEPLEGTGLHLIVEQIFTLSKIIETGMPNQFLIDSFNLKTKNMYHTWTDTLALVYLLSKKKDTPYWEAIYNLKTNNLDFSKINHYHDLHDYSYRIMSHGGHNYTNDLFNNAVRGSGVVNSFNQADLYNFSIYNKINVEDLSNHFYNIFINNENKWKNNAEKSLHIYDFLIKENAIKE